MGVGGPYSHQRIENQEANTKASSQSMIQWFNPFFSLPKPKTISKKPFSTPKCRRIRLSGDGRWWLIHSDKPTNISRTWARTWTFQLECYCCVCRHINGTFTGIIYIYFQSLLDYHIFPKLSSYLFDSVWLCKILHTYASTWCYLFRCLKRFHCERIFIVCSPGKATNVWKQGVSCYQGGSFHQSSSGLGNNYESTGHR